MLVYNGWVSCKTNTPEELESYKVTFEFVGAEGSVTETVVDGEKLSEEQIKKAKSKIPEGFEFVNLYSDKECKTEFDTHWKNRDRPQFGK